MVYRIVSAKQKWKTSTKHPYLKERGCGQNIHRIKLAKTFCVCVSAKRLMIGMLFAQINIKQDVERSNKKFRTYAHDIWVDCVSKLWACFCIWHTHNLALENIRRQTRANGGRMKRKKHNKHPRVLPQISTRWNIVVVSRKVLSIISNF